MADLNPEDDAADAVPGDTASDVESEVSDVASTADDAEAAVADAEETAPVEDTAAEAVDEVGTLPDDPALYDQAAQVASEPVQAVESAYEAPAVAVDGLCPDCNTGLHPSSPDHCLLCGWDAGSAPKGAVTTAEDLTQHVLDESGL